MRCVQRIGATVWELEVYRPVRLDFGFESLFVKSVGTPGFRHRRVEDERGADFSGLLAEEDSTSRFALVGGVFTPRFI